LARAARVFGDVQLAKAAESTRHWNVEPDSDEVNAKVGVESLVGPLGPELIVVFGAWVSTVKLRLAGLWSTFPWESEARTSKVWGPLERAAAGVCVAPGPEQGANEAESKRHSKVDPASSEEKPNVGVESAVGALGPESTVVSGGLLSPDARPKFQMLACEL
jgi:hypothetical protein